MRRNNFEFLSIVFTRRLEIKKRRLSPAESQSRTIFNGG